ncbi:unnamed protein product, partial [Symbiodinium microadriaticum]
RVDLGVRRRFIHQVLACAGRWEDLLRVRQWNFLRSLRIRWVPGVDFPDRSTHT